MTKADLARLLKVTPTTAGNLVLRGCPLSNEAEVNAWYEIYRLGVTNGPKPPPLKPRQIDGEEPTEPTNLTLDEMLLRLQTAEFRAGQEVENASPGADRQCALRAYNQAAKNRVEIEQEVIKLKRETRQLLSPEQCEEILAALRPVVAKMDTGPQSLAFKCNPSDPELAMNALADYFEGLKADFRKALGE